MNKDLTINLKDALLLVNVHFRIGPKTCRVSCQLLAFIRTDAVAFLNAKDKQKMLKKGMTINLKDFQGSIIEGITSITSHGSHAVGPVIDAQHEQRKTKDLTINFKNAFLLFHGFNHIHYYFSDNVTKSIHFMIYQIILHRAVCWALERQKRPLLLLKVHIGDPRNVELAINFIT